MDLEQFDRVKEFKHIKMLEKKFQQVSKMKNIFSDLKLMKCI